MNDGIFVSYSHNDSEVVEQIVTILKEATGKEVWFDYELRGGENYFSVIANQIINSKYFVFIVSAHSVESDWCLRELEFAASEKRRIVAVWLDNIRISPRIRLVIQNTQYINWYAVTTESFTESVCLAFNDYTAYPEVTNSLRDTDLVGSSQQKYFLDNKELSKLSALLQAEKNEQYSICFLPENANLLGIAYELGITAEADLKKADFFYKVSKYYGNPDGQYLYAALKYQTEGEKQACIADMLDAAEQGGILAMTYVGDCYYKGTEGFPADRSKAYEYYELAAKAGGTVAMYYTAYGYRIGECLPKDHALAYMYALRAKEKGFPRAYRLLGFMYRDGQFVEKNLLKSIELFREAINRGDHISYCHLGDVHEELGETARKAELYQKAVELAEQEIIESGIPFCRLAGLYEAGKGVEQDYETAARYYLKAAQRKYENALQQAVPCILHLERGKRAHYLQKAYALNCKRAAYELGLIEKKKRKNKKEKLPQRAVDYFEAGAEQGDMYCVMELIRNDSCVLGNGTDRADRQNAIKWFRFFFANANHAFIHRLSEDNVLATYYYAYAIELDYDPDVNKQDREFVLYNFKKSVEDCPLHLGNIIDFAVNGYLFPKESESGLEVDVLHAEEVLNFAVQYLNAYFEFIQRTKPESLPAEMTDTKNTLGKGYAFLSRCYNYGHYVAKNRDRAELYKSIAAKMYI